MQDNRAPIDKVVNVIVEAAENGAILAVQYFSGGVGPLLMREVAASMDEALDRAKVIIKKKK